MKSLIIKFSALLSVIFVSACKTEGSNGRENDSLNIENPYLGQKPPGLTPIPFAPGLVSTEIYEYDGAFTPDLKAFYFMRKGEENIESAFYEYKYNEINGIWEKSEVASS